MTQKQSKEIHSDSETEAKIIEAARILFTKKGYASTKTREIAQEAGINPALLNYYFRSKEKLFHLVMTEKLQQFFEVIHEVVNDEMLSLEAKMDKLTDQYITVLTKDPGISLFIFNELKGNVESFRNLVNIDFILNDSSFAKQLKEQHPLLNPLQFIQAMLGLIVFPFISKPVFFNDDKSFSEFIQERKALLKTWTHYFLSNPL